jgi:hypothetical protein
LRVLQRGWVFRAVIITHLDVVVLFVWTILSRWIQAIVCFCTIASGSSLWRFDMDLALVVFLAGIVSDMSPTCRVSRHNCRFWRRQPIYSDILLCLTRHTLSV